jgi:hypothetical protein
MRLRTISLVTTLVLCCVPNLAFAYIDPNAGGILFQILTPLFIVIVAFWVFLKQKVKAAWTRIRSRFRKPGVD